jgi:hypothetical protein
VRPHIDIVQDCVRFLNGKARHHLVISGKHGVVGTASDEADTDIPSGVGLLFRMDLREVFKYNPTPLVGKLLRHVQNQIPAHRVRTGRASLCLEGGDDTWFDGQRSYLLPAEITPHKLHVYCWVGGTAPFESLDGWYLRTHPL